MVNRMSRRLAISSSAIVLVGCGIFVAFQNLGIADDYAIIASFFLALVTAAASLFTFASSKSENKTENTSNDDHQPTPEQGTSSRQASNCGVVQQGDGAIAYVETVVMPWPDQQ